MNTTTPKEKTCTVCKLPQPIDNFYYNRKRKIYTSMCKECHKKDSIQRRNEKYITDGHERIRQYPNTYNDAHEKQQTFQLMQLIGWKFNTVNNKWYKEPIKDSNGYWFFQRKKVS